MESSTSKVEIMKPMILKAGIPLALSVAGFVCAKIIARRSVAKESLLETQMSNSKIDSELGDEEESFHSFCSTSLPSMEYEKPMITDTNFMNSIERLENRYEPNLKEEIFGLRQRLEDLQMKECELEMKFIRFCDLKEQESLLMQLKNTLLLEMSHVELLDREISSMEAEKKRLETLVVEYLRVLEQLEFWKSKNGFLHRKVKKLLRKVRAQSSLIKEQDLQIGAKERQLFRTQDELETSRNIIKKLKDEVSELKMKFDQQQEEKNGLLEKLELAEKSPQSISKVEAEGITMEDYNRLRNELEQLQKDQAAETEELIYLRWSNACLRHELMKNQEHDQEQNQKIKVDHLELDFERNLVIENYESEQELQGMMLERNGHCFDSPTSEQVHSKRKKLLQRLRKWVEGSEKGKEKLDEKDRHEVKCFRKHSVSEESEEHLQPRRSCSSAGP
ncbi:hypothetical protein FEM48_Zijuj12G0051100 [Ziziphus jujuba var. spinosa]|uniref:Protein CHUP1, chloroplastic n=1 Tax=Ziziphus jujuba var. spinosa TaxID=714518 RepID=A0A978UBC4_ZIZJJ|nr:hypothetical protein FEM48_Zijuj12G0051100 [Ziziphus jujuba var. spinosa]